jgi:hypothetical protein
MTHLSPAISPPDDGDPFEGYPANWSDSAIATFAEIEAENPNLDAASLATLSEACNLLSAADIMQARIDADGVVVKGSVGQPAAHPLISEVRMARVQALAALRALGLGRGQSSASQAGAALAAKKWNGNTAGVRAGR